MVWPAIAAVVGIASAAKGLMSSGKGGGADSDAARNLYNAQADISREQWDQYKQVGAPILGQLGEEVRGPQSKAISNQEVARAGADVGQSYDAEQARWRRSVGRYGLNPGSGRFAAGLRATSLSRAGDRAGAMTSARRNTRLDFDRKRFGVLAAAQGQAGQAQAGLASAGAGYGSLAAERNRRAAAEARGWGELAGTSLQAATVFSGK